MEGHTPKFYAEYYHQLDCVAFLENPDAADEERSIKLFNAIGAVKGALKET